MKKGIANGPAVISINDKRICKTSFSDHVEFVKSSNHPVGKSNLISTDRALLNCMLGLLFIICLVLIRSMPDIAILWIIISLIIYFL